MTQSLKILVVDDDKDNAASLGELFELEGHAVQVVYSGEAAIAAFLKQSFDVAFMDVMMPGKNGVESFLEIRRQKPNARVYMMTGYSVEELLQQAISSGALGVLEKPFDAGEVLRMTEFVGDGIVIANPATAIGNTGQLIHRALSENGVRCKHVTEACHLDQPLTCDEVLVLDTHDPVIDGIELYRRSKAQGHLAPTFLVPPIEKAREPGREALRDISITGVLNKPFDPLDLLLRLPVLAA